jgi:hypothetical protein
MVIILLGEVAIGIRASTLRGPPRLTLSEQVARCRRLVVGHRNPLCPRCRGGELADDQRYLGILSNFSECAPLLPDSP